MPKSAGNSEPHAAPARRRLLLLVRNKTHRELLNDWLSENYEIVSVDPARPFEEAFDLTIIDGPGFKRLRPKIKALREEQESVLLPFLLLAQRRKGSVPTRHLGLVDDVILKPLDRIEVRARVANLLRVRALSLRLKKEHDRVLKLSVTDDVSGFHNTRFLHRYLDRFMASPRARERQVSLVFFDMDNFKKVVDTHGHLLGAKVLREVAQLVDQHLDEEDRIVRYGGDEFVIILPGQDKETALAKVERVRAAIHRSDFLQKENLKVRVTASFGLATFPFDARDKKALLVAADQCLFRSKGKGKNSITIKRGGDGKTEAPSASRVLPPEKALAS